MIAVLAIGEDQRALWTRARCVGPAGAQRQRDREEGAALGGVADGDRAAVQLGDLADDREPEAGAARARITAIALEDDGADIGRDARTVVGDLQDQAPGRGAQRAAHHTATRRVADRVGQQVADDRDDLLLVGDGRQPGRDIDAQVEVALRGDAAKALGARAHDGGDIDDGGFELELDALQARDEHQVLHAAQHRVGVGADARDVVGVLGGEAPGLFEARAEGEHDRQRRLQLVAEVGQLLAALVVGGGGGRRLGGHVIGRALRAAAPPAR